MKGLILVGEVRGSKPTKTGKHVLNVEIEADNLKVLSENGNYKRGDKFQSPVYLFGRCEKCGAAINDLIGENH